MEASTALNLVTLGVSVLALSLSVFLTRRQVKAAVGANIAPVVLTLFREYQEPAFIRDRMFVVTELSGVLPVELGVRGQDEETRTRIYRVCGKYEDLGKLVAFGVIDPEVTIGSIGPEILRVWQIMEPYVLRERELARVPNSQFWIFFEHLAYLCSVNPPSEVRKRLKLRHFDGSIATLPVRGDDGLPQPRTGV